MILTLWSDISLDQVEVTERDWKDKEALLVELLSRMRISKFSHETSSCSACASVLAPVIINSLIAVGITIIGVGVIKKLKNFLSITTAAAFTMVAAFIFGIAGKLYTKRKII